MTIQGRFSPVGEVHLLIFLPFFKVHDGYFVHYFAPRGLPVVPKDVIFVIDISGSMIGTKIKQVKWSFSLKSQVEDTKTIQIFCH